MRIIRLTYPFQPKELEFLDSRHILTIGYFDGVHLGHQALINRTKELARLRNLPSSIMTFHPHPREVLGHVKNARYITPFNEKLKQFERLDVDHTFILTFDDVLSKLSPEAFIDQVLIPLRVDSVVVGFNFTFGHLGKGTTDLLRDYAGERFDVSVVRPVHLDDVRVSSTLIREQLHSGHMQTVRDLLGRPYHVTGNVVQGEGRGHTIGIPTANLKLDAPYALPPNGVYAVRVILEGSVYQGVLNIGRKPTFHESFQTSLEVHIFDFSRTIYGQRLDIEFQAFLREERKFASPGQLVEQIRRDMEQAKTLLGSLQ
ncbi:bifunctional riboflavin kinase/FAD synthetase [Ferviditalea candida]|uniref:Riboflavin biosynthesis protein n=1 Tax=Ferviditalea candida TaxID=3108399 RepID=A0ABU5ZJ42_9BACL|nr:bifunctional riboflavin kinase/FAD synthetase [Paenibacillaceae bacterium T2]